MKKRQEGVAMIVVMCVMVMVLALSLALLLISSVLITNANRAGQKEQCRVAAEAVSNLLEKEIEHFSYEGFPEESTYGEKEDSLEDILGSVYTNQWKSYDKKGTDVLEGKKNRNILSYRTSGGGIPGETKVEMYWMHDEEQELDPGDPADARDIFMDIRLYVRVTNTVGEESSTVISQYEPDVTLGADPEKPGEQKWTNWKWTYKGHVWEGEEY